MYNFSIFVGVPEGSVRKGSPNGAHYPKVSHDVPAKRYIDQDHPLLEFYHYSTFQGESEEVAGLVSGRPLECAASPPHALPRFPMRLYNPHRIHFSAPLSGSVNPHRNYFRPSFASAVCVPLSFTPRPCTNLHACARGTVDPRHSPENNLTPNSFMLVHFFYIPKYYKKKKYNTRKILLTERTKKKFYLGPGLCTALGIFYFCLLSSVLLESSCSRKLYKSQVEPCATYLFYC